MNCYRKIQPRRGEALQRFHTIESTAEGGEAWRATFCLAFVFGDDIDDGGASPPPGSLWLEDSDQGGVIELSHDLTRTPHQLHIAAGDAGTADRFHAWWRAMNDRIRGGRGRHPVQHGRPRTFPVEQLLSTPPSR